MHMNYNAVIFDLDGVITDTARYHYLGWKKLADELRVYFNEEINERLRGVSRMESLAILLERDTTPRSEEDKVQLATRKNEYYVQMLREKMSPEDILPGALDCLEELRKRRIATALNSASRNAPFVLEKLNLGSAFDYVVDAAAIVNGKPHPESFLDAAAGLKVIPERCIGVEDAAAGIESIKTAGMFAVGVGNPETVKKADLILKDMTEYPEILKRLENGTGGLQP